MNLLGKIIIVPAILALCAAGAFAAKGSQAGNMNKHTSLTVQANNPTVVYVDENSTATSPDGKTWKTAYPSLVEAMQSNLSGKEEIWIAKRTNSPSDGTDNSTDFTLSPNYGEFSGKMSDNAHRVVNRFIINGHKDQRKNDAAHLTYPIVDTNQGLCYDNSEQIACPVKGHIYYGQDAQYTGNTPSYTDNGDGSITDNVTGLIWTQDISTYAMPWSEASSYCESLTTGGYSDWRLPTVKELWSIRDFSQGWPWVDTKYFHLVGDGSEQRQQHSWTSNLYLVKSEYQNEQVQGNPAFIVNDWTGHIKAMSGSRFVRAVRGTTTYGINDFVVNGDGTVSDNATGLMWSQDDNGEAINWEAALAYAETATTAGYDDWRLPNAKELQSIADYSGVFPAINTSVFHLTKLTNKMGQTDYPFYWTSTSNPYIEAYHQETDDTGSGLGYVPGYTYAWMLAVGYCTDPDGYDLHGSGAVVFDTKAEDVSDGSGIEVFYHHVRLVRGGKVTRTPAGDPSTVDEDRVVSFPDGDTGNGENPPEGGEGSLDFSPGVEYLATIGITVTAEELAGIIAGPPAPAASEVVAHFAAHDAAIVITEEQAQTLLDTLYLL